MTAICRDKEDLIDKILFKSLKKDLIEDFVLDKKTGKFAFVVRTADCWGAAQENEMELREDDDDNKSMKATPVSNTIDSPVKMVGEKISITDIPIKNDPSFIIQGEIPVSVIHEEGNDTNENTDEE